MEVVLECPCPFDYGKGLGDFGNFRCVFIFLWLEGLPLNLKILNDIVPMHTCGSQVMAHGVVVSNKFTGDSQSFLGFHPKHESWHWDSLTTSCTWIRIGDSPPRHWRLSASCCSASLSKSARSSMLRMPSCASWTTIACCTPIWSAFSKKAVVCAAVSTIFDFKSGGSDTLLNCSKVNQKVIITSQIVVLRSNSSSCRVTSSFDKIVLHMT